MDTEQKLRELLEQAIDRYSLAQVLTLVYEVCMDKAEHVLSSWQDRYLARAWAHAGGRVGFAANHREVLLVSSKPPPGEGPALPPYARGGEG